MKVKFLEYKVWKGNHVRVQSHNKLKGKWKENPSWEFHNKVANGEFIVMFGIDGRFTKRWGKDLK